MNKTMSNPLAASKKLMQNYLSELLTDESSNELENLPKSATFLTKDKILKSRQLDQLLQNVSNEEQPISSVKSTNRSIADDVIEKVTKKEFVANKNTVQQKVANSTIGNLKNNEGDLLITKKDYRQGNFQAIFFDVAGLIIAVPLIELGGIHNVDKTTSLVGKPEWFKGVMVHREDKINIVDTALWVMPEKCNQKLKDSLNYKYVIMLNNSSWGLMAEHLVDTVTLEQADVKWLDTSSKRPWLAGLVKDKMCALLDVGSLVKLLDNGADINQNE